MLAEFTFLAGENIRPHLIAFRRYPKSLDLIPPSLRMAVRKNDREIVRPLTASTISDTRGPLRRPGASSENLAWVVWAGLPCVRFRWRAAGRIPRLYPVACLPSVVLRAPN